MHVMQAEPLLKKKASKEIRSQLYFFSVTILILFFGLWQYQKQEFSSEENPLAIELPGSTLAGCKVITGAYIEHYKGFLSKEVHLAQKGCMGRDIEIGSRFTVYGDTVTMSERKGEILKDGRIVWPDGQLWTPLTTSTSTTTTSGISTTTASTAAPNTLACDNVSGTYDEYQEANGEVMEKDVMFTQTTGCSGFDYNKIPFTVAGHTITMNFKGVPTEGQIQADGSIHWSNGFIHKPKLTIGKMKSASDILDDINKPKSTKS